MCFHGKTLFGNFLFPILFTFLLFHPYSSMHGNNITDEHALLAFKAGLISDPFQHTASWNESIPLCKWVGITCGRKHQRVVKVNLTSSNLQGSLSPAIGNLSFVRVILLNKNSFTGIIPSEIGRLSRLQILNLADNLFSGEIPKNMSQCRLLNDILLGGNNLTGKLPVEFQSLSKLQHMYVYRNKLTGRIPPHYGNLSSLIEFYVAENNLQGVIPNSFGKLNNLSEISLGINNLSGKIPSFQANFSLLTYLNLSNNDLEGEVPLQGIFGNKSAVFLEGNSKLCGGIQELQLPKCSSKEISEKSRMSLRLKMGISISCGILASVLVVLFIWAYLHRRRKKNTSLENQTKIKAMPMVSYKSLHNATNGFSQQNLIGSGKFSSVYRAHLDEQGKVVSIKVLKLQVKGASKSFIAECDALRHIRHRNLVKVVSSCSSIDYQGNDFKAIIFEYMEEGNLETWLYHHSKANDQNNERTNLSLLDRVNIGIDIACALHYLHVECGTPLVHCDLKPSNVLLDCDLVAHVSDFGLARFLPESAHTSSLGVKGTVGYAAPEYGMGSEFSTFGDMYSYGILLLEIFTGKSPTNDSFIDGLNLHEYAKFALPGRVMEIADPTMLYREDGTSSKSSHDKVDEILLSVFWIGIACSVDSPRERMDACTVMNKLLAIKANLLM